MGYDSPANVDIARLFGDPTINLLAVQPSRDATGLSVTIANTRVSIGQGFEEAVGKSCTLGIRPEDLTIADDTSEGAVPVDLLALTPLNERFVVLMKTLDGQEVLASSGEPPLEGRHTGRAYMRVNPDTVLLFDGASGDRIHRADAMPAAREKVTLAAARVG